MNNKNIFRNFFKYVSFNVLGQLAYSCYTLADTFFISANLGTNGLAALNLAFPVFCFINGTGLMIGMGGGTKYSILKSQAEYGRANKVFTNSVYLIGGFAAIFVLLGVFFSGVIVRLLGADDTIFSMTNTYLRAMLLFSPAFLTNNLLQCFVRNDGAPSLSMAAMITGSLSNVVLDYIFIFPLKMGILGAILATGMAPIISIIVLSSYFIRKNHQFHFTKGAPNSKRTLGILSSGIPAFITEASSGIVMVIFNFIILRLEKNTGVAAYGVIAAISLVVTAIYTGLSQGIQPLISQNYGMGNTANVKSILRYALSTMFLLSGVIYLVVFFCASPIASVFNSEQNEMLQRMAVIGLKLYFIACPFVGFNIVISTYFTSIEHPRPAHVISLLRGFFVVIPMAFLLSAILKMIGVWCAFPITELIVAVVGVVLYLAEEGVQRLQNRKIMYGTVNEGAITLNRNDYKRREDTE